MPPYRWWEWSDPEVLGQQHAQDFLAGANDIINNVQRGQLQEHIGGILESISGQRQASPPAPVPAPAFDPMAALRGAGSAVGAGLGDLGAAADRGLRGASAALHASPIAPALDTALDFTGANEAWDRRTRQGELNKQAEGQGFPLGAIDPGFAKVAPEPAAEYQDTVHQDIMGSIFGAGGGIKVVRGPMQQKVAQSYGSQGAHAAVNLFPAPTVRGAISNPQAASHEAGNFLVQQLFDDLHGAGRVAADTSASLGRKLGFGEDLYKVARMARAANEVGGEWFEQATRDVINPKNLQAISGSADQGLADLNDLLRARDAIDKGAAIGLPNRKFGGMTAADAADGIDEIKTRLGPRGFAHLEDSAQKLWDFGHELLDRKVMAGLVDPAMAQQLKAQYPHYMPIKIIDYLGEDGSGAATRVGGAINDIKKLTDAGTDRVAEAPLQAYMRQSIRTSNLVARQEMADALVDSMPHVPWLSNLVRPGDNVAAQRMGLPTSAFAGVRPNEVEMKLFVQGQPASVYLDKSLKPLLDLHVSAGDNPFLKMFGAGGNALRKGAVAYNPTFGAGQYLMDAFTMLVNEGGLLGGGKSLGYLAEGTKAAFAKNFGKTSALRDEAARLGALPGSIDIPFAGAKPDAYADVVDRMTGQATTWQQFWAGIRSMNESFDAAPRLAEFAMKKAEGEAAARAAGTVFDPREAALAARDVTLDFSRGGSFVRSVNTVVPFYNVQFQGAAYAPRRLFSADPAVREKAWAGAATGVVLPAMLLEHMNQQDPRYADVPDYDKNRGFIIMGPDNGRIDPDTGRPNPTRFLVRTGPFTPLVLLGRALYQAMAGKDVDEIKLAAGLLKSGSPMDTSGLFEAGVGQRDPGKAVGGLVADILPPGVKTGVEWATGYDFFRDRPIVPKGLENQPKERQYSTNTSEVAKLIGAASARLWGGQYAMSPASIDHLLKAWGGLSQGLVAGADMSLEATGLATSGQSQRADKIMRELAKTGLSDGERTMLEQELARESAIVDERKGNWGNTPVAGGAISKFLGYREGGGQSLEDRGKLMDQAILNKKRDTSPAGKELARIGVDFGDVENSIGGVRLTRQQSADYREHALAYRERILNDLVVQDFYASADDKGKERLLKDAMARGAGWAASEVLPGRAAQGGEFTESFGGDLDKATVSYMKYLKTEQDQDTLRRESGLLGVRPEDYDEVAQDKDALSKMRGVLGQGAGDSAFIHQFGASRYARARMARENPAHKLRADMLIRGNPDYQIFDLSTPQTITRRGMSPEMVARLIGG